MRTPAGCCTSPCSVPPALHLLIGAKDHLGKTLEDGDVRRRRWTLSCSASWHCVTPVKSKSTPRRVGAPFWKAAVLTKGLQ